MRQKSPEYLAGYTALLAGKPRGYDHGRSWLAGWDFAFKVKRGEKNCPVCGGGHAVTPACDPSGGIEPVRKRPETRNICVISTAHLTTETAQRLSGSHSDWPIYGGTYGPKIDGVHDGFFVHVAEPGSGTLPDDLEAACVWAKSFKPPFDYIMFDQDADAVEDLKSYC